MADLLRQIEDQIASVKATTATENVGVIREIGDGVAPVEGLSDAMLNEMLDLGHGITGLALNLEETEVGVIILGDYTKLEKPVDGKGPIQSTAAYPVEKLAPGIIRRRPVSQPVQTGIMSSELSDATVDSGLDISPDCYFC